MTPLRNSGNPPGTELACKHERVARVAPIYVAGRPLYKCLTCGSRFVYEDDEPSNKGLAPVRFNRA